MSSLDVIPLPGHSGMFARRVAVGAWQRAGSPPVNSAGRLYAVQKHFWDGWRKRLPGFNPADNPDDESQRLAHVRFVAFDIDPTPDRIRRLAAAGFVRPYWYEPWHWELPNVRGYSIVRSIPTPAADDITPITEESEIDMSEPRYVHKSEKGTEYMVIGEDVDGGWDASTDIKEGEAMGVLYGRPDGSPWIQDMPYDRWVRAQQLARKLNAAKVAREAAVRADLAAKIAAAVGQPASGATHTLEQIAEAVNDDAAARLRA